MPDPTDLTAPTPAPDDNTPFSRGPASGLNQAQIASLAKALDIVNAALDPARVNLLIDSDGAPDPASDDWNITLENLQTLAADIQAAQQTSGNATGATNQRRLATADEETAETLLIREIQYFQSRAKQKHARKRPQLLANYHIGHRLDGTRDNLEQYARDILLHAGTDQLPGVNPARLATLQQKLMAWIEADALQGRKQGSATTLRGTIKQQLETITDRRLTLQYAADALFPYWDDQHYATRRAFHLTLNRPFDG